MDNKLSPEYFHLIRKVLREKPPEPHDRPLKRKRRKVDDRDEQEKSTPSKDVQNIDIVTIESDSESERVNLDTSPETGRSDDYQDSGANLSDQEDYDSDDFEDVTEPAIPVTSGDLSITIQQSEKKSKNSALKARNICSNEERRRRRYYHMAHLACLMAHGALVNEWINNSRLLRRLSRLIPENLISLLHPSKDDELPLRSTRKLLDGLRKCMELWQKHWKVKKRYAGLEYYMRGWQELTGTIDLKRSMTEKDFVRQIIKGQGNCDLATQGFVALLRSCNVNARLVMSCQPPDFTNLKERESISTRHDSYESLFKYPIFWCEVWDKFGKKWITIDPTNFKTIEQIRNHSKLEPRGVSCCRRNMLRYVIGYDRKNGCRDITRRYSSWFNSKCRKRRITNNADGSQWYGKVLMTLHRRKRTKIDDYEEEYFEQRDDNEGMPDNLQDLKGHPKYILEKDIRNNQVLKPGCKECGYLNVNHGKQILKVYDRKDLIDLKSAKQWYMEGRILKVGCRCRKKITKSNRRLRQREDHEAEEEEERLYSLDDTEVYRPSPASDSDGKIEKNAYGNIEIFTSTMIPENCCLIESPHAIKAAKCLEIEYARAVTGFKFERGNASKPIISGVVVARWFKEAVLASIDGIEYSIQVEEREKAELEALKNWNIMLLKLRIKSNLNASYGKVGYNGGETTIDIPRSFSGLVGDGASENSDISGAEGGGFFPTGNIEMAKPPGSQSEDEVDEATGVAESGGFLTSNNEVAESSAIEHNGESNEDEEDDEDKEVANETSIAADANSLEVKKTGSLDPKYDDTNAHDEHYDHFLEELGLSDED